MQKQKISIFWFRRDLRIEDNIGLMNALEDEFPVLPIFIFDKDIIDELPNNDARIGFIHERLSLISEELKTFGSSMFCQKGIPATIWNNLLTEFDIQKVYTNEDYEPYAIKRDAEIKAFLETKNIEFLSFKDQVIFAKNDVLKGDNTPYTVYTPYKNKWIAKFKSEPITETKPNNTNNFAKIAFEFPNLEEIGFEESTIKVQDFTISDLANYKEERNFPALNKTSYLSPHLRFGTVSIREIVLQVVDNEQFLFELIWREFFMQILFHFPHVVTNNFRPKYDGIKWRNNPEEFEKWKTGKTGYPMVDAGIRELNTTGYMHNRVRMVVAGFLCKHLLIDWRWGEAYFAEKLLDYELSANNGNWQWAAGTGCDAAPYFRVFNPTTQIKNFDPKLEYIKKWVPELDSFDYPLPMVEHKAARERALSEYKKGIALYGN